MKFVLAFVAFALVAAVNGKPTNGFADIGMAGIEGIQVDARKIGYAAKDLEILEAALFTLDAESGTVAEATIALTDAMTKDTTWTKDQYTHASTA
jgi:hypothetical protein